MLLDVYTALLIILSDKVDVGTLLIFLQINVGQLGYKLSTHLLAYML